MDIIRSGMIELAGMRFSAETRSKDLEKAVTDDWELDSYDQGAAFLTSVHPIRMDGVDFQATVFFSSESDTPEITLHPIPDDPDADGYDAQQAFQISQRWLRAWMSPAKPSQDAANALAYTFEWGQIYTALVREREFGWEGGTVEIRYPQQKDRTV